jgi:hypothetical protein
VLPDVPNYRWVGTETPIGRHDPLGPGPAANLLFLPSRARAYQCQTWCGDPKKGKARERNERALCFLLFISALFVNRPRCFSLRPRDGEVCDMLEKLKDRHGDDVTLVFLGTRSSDGGPSFLVCDVGLRERMDDEARKSWD